MPTTPRSGGSPSSPTASRSREAVVLKLGGSVAGDDDAALGLVASLNDAGRPLVVVHGGGPLVGEWATKLGLETRFERGLRVTDAPTRDVALAVLAGLVNKTLVARLLAKVEACLVASQAGCRAAIVSARDIDAIEALLAGETAGTVFEA